jgi:hypothetical protein
MRGGGKFAVTDRCPASHHQMGCRNATPPAASQAFFAPFLSLRRRRRVQFGFLAFKAQPRTLPFGSRAEPEQVGTRAQTQKTKRVSAQVFEACDHGPLPCTYFLSALGLRIENGASTEPSPCFVRAITSSSRRLNRAIPLPRRPLVPLVRISRYDQPRGNSSWKRQQKRPRRRMYCGMRPL